MPEILRGGGIATARLAAEELAKTFRAFYIIDSQVAISALTDNSPSYCSNLFRCQEVNVRLLQ